MTEAEVRNVIAGLAGDVFELFRQNYPVDSRYYSINRQLLTVAVQNAATDLNRVGVYHSDTGANIYKVAAYVGKWLSQLRPIQIAESHPVNLASVVHLDVLHINAYFAVYSVWALLGDADMYLKLRTDLRYCFEFRYRMDADSIAMLLEHSIVHAPAAVQKSAPNKK